MHRGASEGGQVEVFGSLAADDQIVRRGIDEIRDRSPLIDQPVKTK